MVNIRSAFVTLGFLALAAAPVSAACTGTNLLDQLPSDTRAELDAKAKAVPYATGNFWQATKGDQSLTVIGTYHLDDPRHDAIVEQFAPLVEAADLLLLEAGPEEEKALQDHIGRDPSLMVITDGPPLNSQLSPEIWERLATAAETRGIPPIMAAKMRPWYLSLLLAIPPCAMELMLTPNGLDHRLQSVADAAGTKVQALEPYDTLFAVFELFSSEDQLAMIEQTLSFEPKIADLSWTLAEGYFAGENRLTWELMRHLSYDIPGFTKAQVDEDMALMEEALMIRRNQAWIPVIEEAAGKGSTVVAFGALHLSGEEGVLNLLERNGWTLTEIAPAP
ncbi:TraB/GumN family protein [Xinfangfangia sp. CPCC 101601]|uniref:TraB/GumN family protein n=1 Tax=Pseudogemmobacter lacusdianii TaxID=3069608 RepID=A0ABU0W037_9RHOB|nr:TraB/GumN family protein [Xinfangfangia sp. CPCC 101601]MDQ2067377.1 TraB/GumN family protein [Xinfangfangia sp. CPCC 101601]